MGCRTANGWDINGFGQLKDGRGNICPVTIILPTLAMKAKELANQWSVEPNKATESDVIDSFMGLLEEKIYEAKDMLIERFQLICQQSSDSAKFMYENGVMEGYDGKNIYSALKHGTLAVGQLGLAETLQILIGCDHTTKKEWILLNRSNNYLKINVQILRKNILLTLGFTILRQKIYALQQ